MRELVRSSRYVMPLHGHVEMESDRLTLFDVEHCFLTGEIVERQRDARTGEWKYLVEGETGSGRPVVAVSKVEPGEKLVVITVYRL